MVNNAVLTIIHSYEANHHLQCIVSCRVASHCIILGDVLLMHFPESWHLWYTVLPDDSLVRTKRDDIVDLFVSQTYILCVGATQVLHAGQDAVCIDSHLTMLDYTHCCVLD